MIERDSGFVVCADCQKAHHLTAAGVFDKFKTVKVALPKSWGKVVAKVFLAEAPAGRWHWGIEAAGPDVGSTCAAGVIRAETAETEQEALAWGLDELATVFGSAKHPDRYRAKFRARRPAGVPKFRPAPVLAAVETLHREGLMLVDLGEIERPTQDHRLEPTGKTEGLTALAESIRQVGVLEPVGLMRTKPAGDPTPYRVIYGRRRVLAAALAGLTTVPAVVFDGGSEGWQAQLAAIENLHRGELNPVEEALAVCNMLKAITGQAKFGRRITAAAAVEIPREAIREVASLLGQSVAWMRGRTVLMRLGVKAANLVIDGRLPLAHAHEVAKLVDAREQGSVATTAARREDGTGGMAIDRLRRLVANMLRSLYGVRWRLDAPFAGRPPCIECPHNSENAAALFATMDTETLARGKCLDPKCYKRKSTFADQAVEAAVKAARAAKAEPTAKGVAVHVPAGVKVGPVVRQLQPAAKAKAKTEAGGGAWEKTPAGKFYMANLRWKEQATKAVLAKLPRDPMTLAALYLARETAQGAKLWGVATTDSTVRRTIGKFLGFLDAVAVGTCGAQGLGGLAALLHEKGYKRLVGNMHGLVKMALADRLGIKLPARPRQSDFEKKPVPVKPAKPARTKAKRKGKTDGKPKRARRGGKVKARKNA